MGWGSGSSIVSGEPDFGKDVDWGDAWKVGAVGAAGFLPMMFGGGGANKGVSAALADLKQNTTSLTNTGKALGESGSDVMGPALQYLKAVTGGDPAAIAEAIKPERRRIIDQYDTAKKNVAEFGPRGGGTAGALAQVNATEAGDLATAGAQARQGAMSQATSTGTALQGLGVGATQAAGQNLQTSLQAYMKQAEDSGKSAADIGMGIAKIVGMFLL